ncbi:hypothetical protein B0J13DRAFT_676159 [Dactylonectria estremocensis]|uniref:Kievitone hydratase n=1 Tax=Dactylonectria estremocensis TaxID=1079267 RepID=A0A9P9ERM4_9HYPO|nr:hypothetical protein B0J13DRAFT_676159 [Dactylonectria estremocensis]
MRTSISTLVLGLLPLALGSKGGTFRPESGGLLLNDLDTLPIAYDLLESQTKTGVPIGSSFWSSSFIHGSDNHDYLILSHVLAGQPITPSLYRGSVLDITDPSRYGRFEIFSNVSEVYSDIGDFNASYPDYGFGSIGSEEAPALRTWSSIAGAEFELTFELSSPALLNGGLGSFRGAGNSTANEWGSPAGKTQGWLSIDGSKVTVDKERSLTWYDRQWGGAPASWTWFELHIESGIPGTPALPFSIWVWQDTPDGSGGLATTREAGGVHSVVPVKSLETSGRTFTSPTTDIVYDLDWTLKLADGTEFRVSSVREDQELYAEGGLFPTYEGFVTVTGAHKDGRKIKGYGLVEIEPPKPRD